MRCGHGLSASSVVSGLAGQPVLIDGAVVLAGLIEDFPESHVRPNLDPLGQPIPGERRAEFVRGRLKILFLEEDFGEAEVRQRVGRMDLEFFAILLGLTSGGGLAVCDGST
jgi:hypothetical protein